MKKVFLGLFLAGALMSFANVDKSVETSDEAFGCTVEIRNGDGELIGWGYGSTCADARELAIKSMEK
ncbi:hypothetical protein M0D21_06530 [Aquimarina sp. D1M17]|uniref:hypothetical protein n=1 Tax=Aquimarina acroporae TaxID=2937283 RepID=UPI0020C0BA6B|nr:hypothetical protein [Aquimarina acroporae]MCK8521213.1 hypothetical protein [Aquimarina acroporae]